MNIAYKVICSWEKQNKRLGLERVSCSNSVPPPSSFSTPLVPHLIQPQTNHHWVLLVVARHRPLHHHLGLCRVDARVQSLYLHSVIISPHLRLTHIKVWIQCNVPNELPIIEVLKYSLLLRFPCIIRLEVSHIGRIWSQEQIHTIQRKAKVRPDAENEKGDQMAARCHRGQVGRYWRQLDIRMTCAISGKS